MTAHNPEAWKSRAVIDRPYSHSSSLTPKISAYRVRRSSKDCATPTKLEPKE